MKNNRICIIGTGYVGLALAVEFGKIYETSAFDINIDRINDLKSGLDSTGEYTLEELLESKRLKFTNSSVDITSANFIIITVGTPIYDNGRPNLTSLLTATKLVGKHIKKNSIIIFESTVYPGATEEVCIPVLEKYSGLKWKSDFYVGYSPERINPGDKSKRINDIIKIVSADCLSTESQIVDLYSSIIHAGLHLASSIKVAESAKVIENTQRDLNIALINEFSIIFDRLGVCTSDVLKAASTKWNFISLKPGLVGGHCISVDPYYLLYKAEVSGYIPTLIHAGRKINEYMPIFVANKLDKIINNFLVTKILIMGFTFKDNCSDIRNTKVYDLYIELINRGYSVDIFDYRANKYHVVQDYQIYLIEDVNFINYDAIVYCVNHDEHYHLIESAANNNLLDEVILFDVTGMLSILSESKKLDYYTF